MKNGIKKRGSYSRDFLNILPKKPGVYIFKNSKDKIIYIGKAKNIYNRVRSYFSEKSRHFLYMKPPDFIQQIKSVDYIITGNEAEALILEGNLIKKNRPIYNIDLKDDKSFPFIAVTEEAYPRVFLTRNRNIRKAKYFGPYTDVRAARNTLEYIRKIFQVRDCRKVKPGKTTNPPCLNYHIGLCNAPCIGNVSMEEYGKNIEYIKAFLRGKDNTILLKLDRQMKEFSINMKFEEALKIKEKIDSINKLHERQRIIFDSEDTWDFIGVRSDEKTTALGLFTYRGGALALVNNFIIENEARLKDDEVLSGFIIRYYENINNIPSKIYVPEELEDKTILVEWFRNEKGRRVKLLVPKMGEKRKIMDMVSKNTVLYLEKKKFEKSSGHSQAYSDLLRMMKILGLKNIPRKLECYDISNLGERFPVGSMTVALDGEIKKEDYRHFKIRYVSGQDDCAMLAEMVTRRLKYLEGPVKDTSNGFYIRPDLIIIDGGKAQFNAINRILDQKGITVIDIISIAKKEEMIFCSRYQNGIKFDLDSEILRVLIRLRDEAHRFAVGYHRKLRDSYMTNSLLDEIKGIGQKKKAHILENIDSVYDLKEKSIEDIMNIKGISYRDAVNIYNSLHR
ncbi:MAG: excinuclease ABC subunit UvrC [Actinobacteria bacterium]|nr:excinuclease ABC subunit UvrC [Actinomycetota bacterium]